MLNPRTENPAALPRPMLSGLLLIESGTEVAGLVILDEPKGADEVRALLDVAAAAAAMATDQASFARLREAVARFYAITPPPPELSDATFTPCAIDPDCIFRDGHSQPCDTCPI